MKIVINRCFGGFGLSEIALDCLKELKGHEVDYFSIARDDPHLVNIVEQLGVLANNFASELKVVEIPEGVSWEIHDYDGMETIHETHRVWY